REGVGRGVRRMVGGVPLGEGLGVVLGVPLAGLAGEALRIEGRMPGSAADVLVGRELARAAGLGPGRRVMLESGDTSRIYTVAGVFDERAAPWSARLIVCELDDAAVLFDEPDAVTDVVLYTRPGYADAVAEAAE